MKRYKFLHLTDGCIRSEYGDCRWQIGEQKTAEGTINLCKNGFHCSRHLWDALRYVKGSVLAEVDVNGDHVEAQDKECWRSMTIVRAWKWTAKDSVALAVYAAESVLPIFEKRYPKDDRPRKAIEAAKSGAAARADAAAARADADAAYAAADARSAWNEQADRWIADYIETLEPLALAGSEVQP